MTRPDRSVENLVTPASLRSDGVAGILQNRWPEWIGTDGRNASEWPADITGIGILNEALQRNEDYSMRHDDKNSPYWCLVDGEYWHKFIQLRPKANEIRDAIRQSLNIK